MEPIEAEQEEVWRGHERPGRPLRETTSLDRIERILVLQRYKSVQ